MKTYPDPARISNMVVRTHKTNISFLILKIIVATLLLLSSVASGVKAQCSAPTLTFHSPVLISGTDKQVGAIYNFAEVLPGVDAHIEILGMTGGAALQAIDDTLGAGYYDAFQPYVVSGANDTSFIDWRITFKVGGTSVDITLPCLAVTGVDVDGNNVDIKEFVEAATPGSYSIDPYSNLQVSFDGVRSKATGQIANIPYIDTAHREAMFQMNFTNINTLEYRNGAISTRGVTDIRQTCIYFKPFFSTYFLLPVKLLSFNAVAQTGKVNIYWSATSEQDNQQYTVQKSLDGSNWKDVTTVNTGVSSVSNNYSVTDNENTGGIVYYRLRQTGNRGTATYSKIIKVNSSAATAGAIKQNTLISNNTISMQISAASQDRYNIRLFAASGEKIQQFDVNVYSGVNNPLLYLSGDIPKGVYFLTINSSKGQQVYNTKLFKE